MNAAKELLKGLLVTGLLILVPVYICQTPEKGVVSEISGHTKVGFAVFSLGRPIEPLHALSGNLLIEILQRTELLGEGFLCGDFGHVRVMEGMVPHRVTFGCHAPDQIRAGIQIIADQKEGGRNLMFFQGIQNSWGIAVLIAGIKGQIKYLFAGIGGIVGVELF